MNQALLTLKRVILQLADGQSEGLAYRETCLTWALRSVLTTNCSTSVLVTCSPHMAQYHATTNTLEFGEQCKGVSLNLFQGIRRLTARELEARLSQATSDLERLRQETDKCKRYLEAEYTKVSQAMHSGFQTSIGG